MMMEIKLNKIVAKTSFESPELVAPKSLFAFFLWSRNKF